MFRYDINVNRQWHAWFERGLDNSSPCKEELQYTHIQTSFMPVLKTNKWTFPSITHLFSPHTGHKGPCSSCTLAKSAKSRLSPDLASLHWLFPLCGNALCPHLLTLTSFKTLLKCHLLHEVYLSTWFKMEAHTFPALTFLFYYRVYQLPACCRIYLLCFLLIVGLFSPYLSLRAEFFAVLFMDGSKWHIIGTL